MYNDDFLQKKLNERKALNAFRSLRLPQSKIDFCSNDYLGIVKNHLLSGGNLQLSTGSSGSRLLAGNYALIEETENEIAVFHQSETALIFNSGYDANIGVLSCLPQKNDTVIYDQLSHASIRDGIRLSFAQSFSFAHNDINDLEKKLKQITATSGKNIFIVTESVFSMDGDFCPLKEIVLLCKKYMAHLILDEAHATAIVGEKGEGLAQQLQLHREIFCRIHTFGKACGAHGAAVSGSRQLKDYLINFARSFIYATALPEHSIYFIQQSYRVFPLMIKERNHLHKLIQQFQSSQGGYEKLISQTPIQIVMVPGNEEVKILADKLQQNNLDVRPVLYPTVPKGKERLRVALHAFNREEELQLLISLLQ